MLINLLQEPTQVPVTKRKSLLEDFADNDSGEGTSAQASERYKNAPSMPSCSLKSLFGSSSDESEPLTSKVPKVKIHIPLSVATCLVFCLLFTLSCMYVKCGYLIQFESFCRLQRYHSCWDRPFYHESHSYRIQVGLALGSFNLN